MSAFLDNSSSSTKRAMFFSLAVAGVAVVLYLFAVQLYASLRFVFG